MTFEVETPKNVEPIWTVYAFCSEDETGNHGIISAMATDDRPPIPLMTGSKHLLPAMERVAKRVGEKANMKVVLFQFMRVGGGEVIHRPIPKENSSETSA